MPRLAAAESDEDDDVPLAAKLQKTDGGGGHARRGRPGTRDGDFPEDMCGPLRRLDQDLLLSIYSRAPRLAARHSRVCWYFYRVLAHASRIHVELSAQTPNRLTTSLLRFVQSRGQQLVLALSDSTALKPLRAVLANEKTRASVRHLGPTRDCRAVHCPYLPANRCAHRWYSSRWGGALSRRSACSLLSRVCRAAAEQ